MNIVDYANDIRKMTEPLLKIVSAGCNQKFGVCFDTVTSSNISDAAAGYPYLTTKNDDLLSVDAKFMTIGGSFMPWIHAGVKRIVEPKQLPKNSELYWFHFSHSSTELLHSFVNLQMITR